MPVTKQLIGWFGALLKTPLLDKKKEHLGNANIHSISALSNQAISESYLENEN